MGSFFKNIMNDIDAVEQELLGPDYSYWKHIKNIKEMEISSDGDAIIKDFQGIMDYIKILVTGRGRASDNDGKPLGNAFFLKTGATCLDVDSIPSSDKKGGSDNSGNTVDRYMYINNIPDGDIPFLSSLADEDFTFLEGLIPGILSNMAHLNPFSIFTSFLDGVNPKCKKVNLKTVDNSNNLHYKEHHVTLTDIKNLNPCWFKSKRNSLTGESCPKKEGFQNRYEKKYKTNTLPEGYVCKVYYTALCLLLLYLLFKIAQKKK